MFYKRIMETKYYSPSVNILRDKDNLNGYIPTRNGEKAFQKITNGFVNGIKSFNIIGAYGTGKSSFLLAVEKVLNQKANYFPNPLFEKIDAFEPNFIVGDYVSFKSAFCQSFRIDYQEDIFSQLRSVFQEKAITGKGQLLIVDEFGKFLEYAAKENPEEELYFIQQLAEFVSSPDLPVLFITTLHQPFEEYALSLSKGQKKEWDKVKGRLIEVSFNEPVEQLLFLASERISQKGLPCFIESSDQEELLDAIQEADVFPLRDYFSTELSRKLFPFDILSASIATVAFQRYGQNERSLFYLLDSEDHLGLNDYKSGEQYFNVACLFDYLKFNFHSLLNSRFNPDSVHWKAIDEALQRAESIFEQQYEEVAKLIKTIGLVSVLGRQGQKLSKKFLSKYASIALGIQNPEYLIEKLEAKQIIRYRNYSQRYLLFKGSDFDLNHELELAEGVVSKEFSVVHFLKKHINLPVIPAKRIFYETGTPRYFVFEISETPIQRQAEGSIDGYINLLFNEALPRDVVEEFSKENQGAVLYGWFKDVERIRNLLIDVEKIQLVKGKCIDDQIALAELNAHLFEAEEEIKRFVQKSFYGQGAEVAWFFQGEQKSFNNSGEMNLFLSQICEQVYPYTPRLKNELMNREKLSGAISYAKKNLVELLLNNSHLPIIGLDEQKFPPEKTIYFALLRATGIHQQNARGEWFLGPPAEASFRYLWDASEKFLSDCALASRNLVDFIEVLQNKPFKLKQGFIEFWVQIFLIAKQKHFALYENDVFVPTLTADTLEVALKQPQKYRLSTYNLSETRLNIFNRYRNFLNLIEQEEADSDTFIETIKPFLVFYKRLSPFALQTKRLTKEAIRLREAISNATDPEKVFFEDIPQALGFTLTDFQKDIKLEEFSIILQGTTRELSGAFSNLVNRIEEVICSSISDDRIGFPDNKILLQKRFKKVKKEQIDPKLRVLLQRINTPLDDRQSWISSIATAILNKSLEQFTDEDESIFQNLFPKRIHELDNLSEISSKDVDEAKEEVFKLELTSLVKGVQKNLIRLPKSKLKSAEEKKHKIQEVLNGNDKQMNIAILIKLLQQEIENE